MRFFWIFFSKGGGGVLPIPKGCYHKKTRDFCLFLPKRGVSSNPYGFHHKKTVYFHMSSQIPCLKECIKKSNLLGFGALTMSMRILSKRNPGMSFTVLSPSWRWWWWFQEKYGIILQKKNWRAGLLTLKFFMKAKQINPKKTSQYHLFNSQALHCENAIWNIQILAVICSYPQIFDVLFCSLSSTRP